MLLDVDPMIEVIMWTSHTDPERATQTGQAIGVPNAQRTRQEIDKIWPNQSPGSQRWGRPPGAHPGSFSQPQHKE